MKTANIVLIILGVFLLAFIAAMVVTFWKFQQVPDSLIEKVLDASQWEVAMLAGIKISKVIKDGFGKVKESEE